MLKTEPMPLPFVIVSAAMSLDGCLDDATPERLVLSSARDWEAVDRLRAEVDAIVIGAGTLRNDNPRLLVKSESLVGERVAAGQERQPLRIVFSGSGNIDPDARLFAVPDASSVVYVSESATPSNRLREVTEVCSLSGDRIDPVEVLRDLHERGVKRVMIEGGTGLLTEFLACDLVNELRLAVAPFFVGDANAPRLVHPARFPQHVGSPLELVDASACEGMLVGYYRRTRSTVAERKSDAEWLTEAVELSENCPKVDGSFAVGAVLVSPSGERLATGYSLETGPKMHAEEVALAKAHGDAIDCRGATMYSSLEPCSVRLSGRRSCTSRILESGIARVVYALAEPPVFVTCEGDRTLRDSGVIVRHVPSLGPLVEAVNRHLVGGEEDGT